ncbi:hypothetical protein EYR41_003372 [Orbilia oligospora]|uniref:Uncharacterized protein n=1 Tax=Orbilia oligospora TaxID=2813651 RepID=A0A7C8TU13_ORBOL|nr:hypothetical protein TWF751_010166 [Orbilia oligospora]TGJ71406.1 hypothetical protein EYR41_003372 [Orbilia oligospora]
MPSFRTLVGAAFCASIVQTVTATPNPTACYADNCLRALRGFGSKSYAQVSTECSNYVWSTVTAQSVATVSETSTVGTTITTEIREVVYETSYEVVTETNHDSTVLVTQTYPDPFSSVNARAIAARTLSIESPIPTYASACTSGARYASACSCYGIFPSVATVASTTTVIELVTTTDYVTTSDTAATEDVTQTVVESTTTVVNVQYTAFAVAVTSADEGFPREIFEPSQTALYIDMTYGIWEIWGGRGGSSIRQPDGKVYYPNQNEGGRWYHYCTPTYVDTDTGEVYQAPTGSMFIDSFPGASPSITGQEVYCSWDSNSDLHCSCTVAGTTYTKMTYHADNTEKTELLLRSGALPAGEWEVFAKAIATNHCAGNTGSICDGWHDPNDVPIWTSWKGRRSLGRKIRA